MAQHSWRYLIQVLTEMEMQRELDDLGSVGWELISAHWEEFSLGGRSHMQARCILKRPVDDADLEESDDQYEHMGLAH